LYKALGISLDDFAASRKTTSLQPGFPFQWQVKNHCCSLLLRVKKMRILPQSIKASANAGFAILLPCVNANLYIEQTLPCANADEQ
jgi:hypothetical protein